MVIYVFGSPQDKYKRSKGLFLTFWLRLHGGLGLQDVAHRGQHQSSHLGVQRCFANAGP